MTGRRPGYVFNDVRDPDKAGLINAEDALRREYRVRLFNRKWLEGMMKEGYAGADQVRFLVSNSFGWEVMRPGSVGNANWQEMKNVLVDDKLQLHMAEWFDRNNPHAYQDMTAVMLEAVRKGYWKADAATTQRLVTEYAKSVTRHGQSGHIRSGGNRALDGLVRGELKKMPAAMAKDLLAKYVARIEGQQQLAATEAAPGEMAAATLASPVAAPAVPPAGVPEGKPDAASAPPPAAAPPPASKPETPPGAKPTAPPQGAQPVTGFRVEGGDGQSGRTWWWLVALVVVGLVLVGLLRRSGTPR
jgi:cobaltochelatase CobN